MTGFDFAPFFRSSIGFDRMAHLLDSSLRDEAPGYPPYNIEKTGEDAYRITMAVAGFGDSDLSIVAQDNGLVITGRIKANDDKSQYLYRGIAGRAFERRFELADYVKVVGASLADGLLHIDLMREVPETKKPRTIRIEPKSGGRTIEGKAA
ncbi:MAG: Hsp20 family protein [Alphaproteobacteria bacterium]|nr:Hsp20 family protein [Alphaproteobacteria bacterium]